MDKHLARYAPYAFAALRIVAGLLFFFHGYQKLTGAFGGHQVEIGTQMGIGAIIELVGGALIALGAGTRIVAFICSGQMAVAYIQFHWKGALDEKFFPAVNQGELAVVYCFLFLAFAFAGAGPLSVDAARAKSPS